MTLGKSITFSRQFLGTPHTVFDTTGPSPSALQLAHVSTEAPAPRLSSSHYWAWHWWGGDASSSAFSSSGPSLPCLWWWKALPLFPHHCNIVHHVMQHILYVQWTGYSGTVKSGRCSLQILNCSYWLFRGWRVSVSSAVVGFKTSSRP